MINPNEVTDGITAGVEARKQRGLQIAALCKIERRPGRWLVPSQSSAGQYSVKMVGDHAHCTCPDHEERGCKCKHIYAVEYSIIREQNADGSTTVTESVTVSQTRKTYPQDWPNYNAAQTNEKRHFQAMLADLCKGIESPAQDMSKGGRPRMPLADAVYAAVFKVYSTMSARRFTSDLCDARAKGHISRVPHFNVVLKALENPALFPIIVELIERSAAPLASVESQFAVDSTGFAYCRFTRWFDIKYGRPTSEQQWVKAHVCCGTKTNVVTAIQIKDKHANDATMLPALVDSTAERFTMKEVSADKAYTGNPNHDAIAKVGATPFIMFRSTTTGQAGGLFKKMFHFFQFKRDEFCAHYHRRSNVESTFMMIKSKFGDAVRSKTDVAARNEVLAKVLCHNICCLISAMYELGIDPVLTTAAN
jgi:transposase